MGSWPRGLQCAVQVWPETGRGTNHSLTGGTCATELLTPATTVLRQGPGATGQLVTGDGLSSREPTTYTEMSERARPGQIIRERPIVLKSIAGFQNSSLNFYSKLTENPFSLSL